MPILPDTCAQCGSPMAFVFDKGYLLNTRYECTRCATGLFICFPPTWLDRPPLDPQRALAEMWGEAPPPMMPPTIYSNANPLDDGPRLNSGRRAANELDLSKFAERQRLECAQRTQEHTMRGWMPPTGPGLTVRAVTPRGQWVTADYYDLTDASRDAYIAWVRSARAHVLPDLFTRSEPKKAAPWEP